MSWSVSNPESNTKTSPCSMGFMVPASTLRYGSILTRLTERPRAVRSLPIEAAAIPLPTALITPPTTKIYLCPPSLRRAIGPHYTTSRTCNNGDLSAKITADGQERGECAENDAGGHRDNQEQ